MKLNKKLFVAGMALVVGAQSAFAADPATATDLTQLTSKFDPSPVTSAVMAMGGGLMTIAVVLLGVYAVLRMANKR